MISKNCRRTLAMVFALGIIVMTANAEAAWRRFSAANCSVNGPHLPFSPAWGVINDTNIQQYVECPLDEDNNLWVDSATDLAVVVERSNTQNHVWAKACVTYDEGLGYACGVAAYDTGMNRRVLHPDLSIWHQTWFGETYAGDYPVIEVQVPWTDSPYGNSSVIGYSINS